MTPDTATIDEGRTSDSSRRKGADVTSLFAQSAQSDGEAKTSCWRFAIALPYIKSVLVKPVNTRYSK